MARNRGFTMTQDDDTPEDAEAFDRDAAIEQLHQTEAALREIARRKREAAQARARAEQARNHREFAINSLLAMEDDLFTLFDRGETLEEILAYLRQSMPGVPVADLRHALKITKARRRRTELKMSRAPLKADAPSAQRTAQSKASQKPGGSNGTKLGGAVAAPRSAAAASLSGAAAASAGVALELPEWADGSDRMPEESEADYILRKHIEGPPEARRKFIGEHNS